jgi:hypothetical protein
MTKRFIAKVKEKTMANKKFWPGTLATVMALGLVLAGCDSDSSDDGNSYTLKFRVDNNTSQAISKVEYINGDKQNDKVLSTRSTTIPAGERSSEHSVSGFNIEYGGSMRKFGVKVTFADNTTRFDWSSAGHGQKVLASVGSYYYISFSAGNW